MKALYLKWLPVFTSWVLTGALLASIIRGIYRSVKYVFGSALSWEEKWEFIPAYSLAIGICSIGARMCGILILSFENASEHEIALGNFLLSYSLAIGIGVTIGGEWFIQKISEILVVGPLIGAIGGVLIGMTLGMVVDKLLGLDFIYVLFSMALGGLLGAHYIGKPIFQDMTEMISKIVTHIFTSLLILWRFRTILCSHCFRYTHPLHSSYDAGIRSCEHCQHDVENTKIVGKIIFTFGNLSLNIENKEYALTNLQVELLTLPQRVFVLSNPDFQSLQPYIEVSEIYLDTKTCHIQKIEQCIAYVCHYLSEKRVKTLRIFYQGQLDDLGERLKNTLQNTFQHIEQIMYNGEVDTIKNHKKTEER